MVVAADADRLISARPSKYSAASVDPAILPDLPRILFVGDSLARNLGRGLGQWADKRGDALIFEQTEFGCALAEGGRHHSRYATLNQGCGDGSRGWADSIARLQVDVVVLLAGGNDVRDQKPPGGSEYLRPGDPAFDDWIVAEYSKIVDGLLAQGVELAWLTYPCTASPETFVDQPGTDRFEAHRILWINEVLIPRVMAGRGDSVTVIDLFDFVCPDGVFTNKLGPHERARADGLHFGKHGRRYVANWLGPQILDLVKQRSANRQGAASDRSTRLPPTP
jgi:hypothetical protein